MTYETYCKVQGTVLILQNGLETDLHLTEPSRQLRSCLSPTEHLPHAASFPSNLMTSFPWVPWAVTRPLEPFFLRHWCASSDTAISVSGEARPAPAVCCASGSALCSSLCRPTPGSVHGFQLFCMKFIVRKNCYLVSLFLTSTYTDSQNIHIY